jgi:hypothetical protein
MSKVKPFFKITFEDMELAEEFFGNDKKYAEFLLAVSYYYRGINYQIKTKIVEKYFNTYKKTMDFIIKSKNTGSEGGLKRAENEHIKNATLQGVVQGSLQGLLQPNNKLLNTNNKEVNIKDNYSKDLFFEIKNFKMYHSEFMLNKNYLLIAYKFWDLWKRENSENKTVKSAKVISWIDTIRLIVEVDKQKIERLIAIYKYFEKCQEQIIGYDDFWFKTIKSVGGLRDTNKKGVYRLDTIMEVVNSKMDKDDAFNRLVSDSIDNFKKYNNECN